MKNYSLPLIAALLISTFQMSYADDTKNIEAAQPWYHPAQEKLEPAATWSKKKYQQASLRVKQYYQDHPKAKEWSDKIGQTTNKIIDNAENSYDHAKNSVQSYLHKEQEKNNGNHAKEKSQQETLTHIQNDSNLDPINNFAKKPDRNNEISS